ncbi:MAG: hypothetical protein K0U72_12095 [Gammaproteobacteria bacterium]|nr:hypothetical protein [Gammaproteobacteria bacterium]
MFSFEALKAKHGDSLLVHYGPENNPRMIIIDGGPSGVWESALEPRLNQISHFRDLRPVPARLTMVSHIDNDHITGVKKMVEHIRDSQDPVVDVQSIWHNSFDNQIGNSELAMLQALGNTSPSVAASMGLGHFVKSIAAGLSAGKKLRQLVSQLGLVVNSGGQQAGFISEGDSFNVGHGTKLTVLNPDRGQLTGLQLKWDKVANKLGGLSDAQKKIVLARVAEDSLANISSIVVHVKKAGKTMLLTGDARGDHVISGLKGANLLQGGKAHVNILKIPHHGSDRNVDTDFFKTVTADHYIFSGDRDPQFGTNPDRATFQMVAEVRGSQKYTMHFTHSDSTIRRWIREDRQQHPSRKYEAEFPRSQDFGIWIDLDNDALWF